MSEPGFEGTIGRTIKDSAPWWPPVPRPASGTPNVVVVVFDDVGFAHFNSYGSSIATPHLNRLADGGLRFVNFHTTALCSPTRACMLTGRNHHAVGMRAISNFDTGFPNMRGAIPRSAATLAEILREQGFGTYMVGKWHLAPMHETGPAGPFHNWPLARGFDHFYGFLQGETDQFRPELVHDQHYIEPPATPQQGYHVTEDLVDHAIAYAHDHVSAAPDRPFFTYLAFGACHSPHQAPAEYLAKYRGQFDEGWDVMRARWFERQKALGVIPSDTVLPPRNPGVKAWDALTDNERRFAACLQEAFAAFLEHTDAHLGRYIDALEKLGQLDNTIFIAMSDNGASQEGGPTGVLDEMRYFNGLRENVDAAVARLDTIGGPDSHTNYPWGWAMVGNTPLKRYKQNTHAGGVRDPFIVHWPACIKEAGAIRRQFHHVTDIAPTILDILGIPFPHAVNGVEQMAVHGTSMAYAWQAGAADEPTRKRSQYFEMFGHRAIWHDGWKAVCYHEFGADYDTEPWELYHADVDASEAHDLAAEHPDKLRALIDLWWAEAGANDVLPLDDRRGGELFKTAQFRGNSAKRTRFVYYPPVSRHSADVAPPTGNRPFSISAEFSLTGKDGVILARGSANGGYVLFVKDHHLVFDYNFFHNHTQVRSTQPLPAGASAAGVRVDRTGKSGSATLVVNGIDCESIDIPEMAVMVSSTGMDVGRSIAPICHDYEPPNAFEGELRSVTVEVAASRAAGVKQEAMIAERVTQGLQ